MVGGTAQIFAQTFQMLLTVTQTLANDATASDELSVDVDPMAMLRAMYGVTTANSGDDCHKEVRRVVDVLVYGARPRG